MSIALERLTHGLTGKNGVKIFEGDIIKNDIDDVFIIIWLDNECAFGQSLLYEPISGVYAFATRPSNQGKILPLSFNFKRVFGNIHENQDLLKSEGLFKNKKGDEQ